MENTKLPAYPQTLTMADQGDVMTPVGKHSDFAGFTKLELASLMIAQGFTANPNFTNIPPQTIAELATDWAKAVLEEANK